MEYIYINVQGFFHRLHEKVDKLYNRIAVVDKKRWFKIDNGRCYKDVLKIFFLRTKDLKNIKNYFFLLFFVLIFALFPLSILNHRFL